MIETLNAIYEFITSGIYDFFVESFSWFATKLTIISIQFKVWILGFSWDVAKEILTTFDMSSKIQTAFDQVPSTERQLLYFFRLPEVISNLMAGLLGRYVFRFIV